MALFERLAGEEQPKVAVHAFQSIAAEWARGQMTSQQAQAAVELISGAPLDGAAAAEAQALVATVTSLGQAVQRLSRMQEIDQVLLLVDCGVYSAAQARARLGL